LIRLLIESGIWKKSVNYKMGIKTFLEIEREEKQKIFNLLPEIIKLEFERSLNE